MIVAKRVSFDAAHFLPHYTGKCQNLHGHRWEVEIGVEGPVNSVSGMVIDFTSLKMFLEFIKDKLDHTLINDTIINPTAENILDYIKKLWDDDDWGQGPTKIKWLKLWETGDSYAEDRY